MTFRKLRFVPGVMGILLLLLSSCSGEKALQELNLTRTAVAGEIYSTQTAIHQTLKNLPLVSLALTLCK